MTETDYEKMRRELRELEGRNVAHYSVLLTAYIRTRTENARLLAVFSASGIALLVVVLMVVGVHNAGRMLVACVALLAFMLALGTSLGILEKSAENLLVSLKEGNGGDLGLEGPSLVAKKSLIIGCIALIALGLVTAWVPGFGNMCPLQKRSAAHAAQNTSDVKLSETIKVPATNAVANPQSPSVSQELTKKSSSAETAKKTGNAGLFQGGVSQ